MDGPQELQALGQSLWLDTITRDLLDTGTLARYVFDLAVAGLTSNPTIFDLAITRGSAYDAEIKALSAQGSPANGCFSNWPSRTSPGPRISSRRFIAGRRAWTDGSLWRSHPPWPTISSARWPRPVLSSSRRAGRICSSRSPGPARGWRRCRHRCDGRKAAGGRRLGVLGLLAASS